jgi:heterodisulfide reductase subunit B2
MLLRKSSKKNDCQTFSFFPGCSLKASGHENTDSLYKFCKIVGIELIELEDWNCCGSSSAHSVDHEVSKQLPMRNLSLSPKGIPLLVACPSCMLRLKQSYHQIKGDGQLRKEYEKNWGEFDDNLEIIHFFEIFERINLEDYVDNPKEKLKYIKVAPYYGCMLYTPPDLRFGKSYYGIIEKSLESLGAQMIQYGYSTKCCGTYLSVAKPIIAENVVNLVVSKAMEAGAECIVTACSMCHLNLEIRCTVKNPIPVFHFSELLSMALGEKDHKKWFPRHIVDPLHLLKKRGLL